MVSEIERMFYFVVLFCIFLGILSTSESDALTGFQLCNQAKSRESGL